VDYIDCSYCVALDRSLASPWHGDVRRSTTATDPCNSRASSDCRLIRIRAIIGFLGSGVSSQRGREEQASCTVNVERLKQGRSSSWYLIDRLNVTAPAVRVVDFTPIRSEEEYYK
jgi:hypothetical protein